MNNFYTTSPSFTYFFSVIVGLFCGYLLQKTMPNISILIILLFGAFTAYISLIIMNYIFPTINKHMNKVTSYTYDSMMDSVMNMGYVQVFPPIIAVLILLLVLLYNKAI